jgi:hypothetical protein
LINTLHMTAWCELGISQVWFFSAWSRNS